MGLGAPLGFDVHGDDAVGVGVIALVVDNVAEGGGAGGRKLGVVRAVHVTVGVEVDGKALRLEGDRLAAHQPRLHSRPVCH